ncbi:MAG TPA: agmatinase [bacterium]|nr:agmatinase [bacterium]
MTFLGARSTAHPAVAVAGVPYDATSTFRSGSRHAPAAIRWASQSIETYSPILGRDLADVAYADLGDVDVAGLRPDQMVDAVRTFVGQMPPSSLPLLLGGEHTIALGAVQALHRTHPDLAVVQIDAHTDLREEYEGQRLSHATVTRRILDVLAPQSLVQLGIRAGTREEFELAGQLRHSAARIDLPGPVWAWLEKRPAYLSIDIDAVDPADAPGTGNPEPAGIPARDLLAFVRRLGLLRVVGLDVVEVSPPYDPSGRTAVLAATIVREAILTLKGTA